MIDDALWQTIAAELPAYLERQRWYGDKTRTIRDLELIDAATVDFETERIALAIIGIAYSEGDDRRYFVPLTLRSTPSPERSTIAIHQQEDANLWIQDAPADAAFRDFLADAGRGIAIPGQRGVFEFEPWQLDDTPFHLDPATQSAPSTVEQSNSSIAYGMQAMAKLYRRIEPGQNIEVDMNRFLASVAHLKAVPGLIGCASYRGSVGTMPLVLVQQHVGEHHDCWSVLTDMLQQADAGSLALVEQLGRVTGEMHVALAGAPPPSALAPEIITRNDTAAWRRAFLTSAEATDQLVRDRASALSRRAAAAADTYHAQSRNWAGRAEDFDLLEGLYKTRIHGDYHLGQVLYTADRRLLVIDFEGEPQRPVHERAAKYSPLRDVAGMLRSLTYARGFAEPAPGGSSDAVDRSWLEQWEQEARTRFVDAYRAVTSAAAAPIIPGDADAFGRALAVLETDKALYEIRYELNSRPDWAWLPLESLR